MKMLIRAHPHAEVLPQQSLLCRTLDSARVVQVHRLGVKHSETAHHQLGYRHRICQTQ